jgi:WD40 repeat protein/serine/threonine protein kinase
MADLSGRKLGEFSGRKLGEFVLGELLGDGGYGAVYRGEQPLLKRHVAVKVLHARHQSDVTLERFEREAQLASRLDHPYAADVHTFGVEDDGLQWIAMELVQGITLSDWLTTRGPMPLGQFVGFFECIAEVVHAAHERGIVHRDLKPSNVMVIERGGRVFPKLLDFGIALIDYKVTFAEASEPSAVPERDRSPVANLDSASGAPVVDVRGTTHSSSSVLEYRLTPTGARFGSAPYMSPEQWLNTSAVGPAADIYSLGIVAYQALTGRLPFTGRNNDEYHQNHRDAKVPALGDGYSSEFDRIIQRALAKSPNNRHRDVLELASEFRAALRASDREQIRTAAQQWEDQHRPAALLWRGPVLANVERLTSSVPPPALSELECSFVAASLRYARHVRWVRRALVTLAAVIAFGVLQHRATLRARMAEQVATAAQERAAMQARAAEQVAKVTVTQAALEQGRSALLHGEPEAQRHLTEAYRHERSPSTAFMLARALQPRLAEQARLPSSFGRMWSATFSPSGAQLVTTDDQNAQIWDAQTYRLLLTLPHGDTVYQAVYSADGKRLITAGGDATVRIWDAANGTLIRRLRGDGAKPRYYAVALSLDDKLVAAIEKEGTVAHVWDASTGAQVAELRNEAQSFPSLAFSRDGHWLATSGGNDVRVFDTKTWVQLLSIPGPRIYALSWDPNGPRLLTGSAEGDASVWAIPSGKRVHHLREVGEPLDAVAFSPDGRLVAAGSRDGAQLVWDTATGRLRSRGNFLQGKILSIEFDRTSTLVVAASASGSVAVTEATHGTPLTVLAGPRNVVLVAHFDPLSRRVVGASWDGTARVWDATPPYRKWSAPPVLEDCGAVTSLEPDQRFLAIGCKQHPTRIWDTAHDQLLAELPNVTPVGGDFTSAYPAVASTGDRAAIARGNTVEVYEVPGGRLLRKITHSPSAMVTAVAFAHTGRDIVSGATDGSLLVTRENGAMLTLPASTASIDAAGFLFDGRLVAVDMQRQLRIYDGTGAALAATEVQARVRTLRMSRDGRRLITVPSFTGKVASPELWDLDHYLPIRTLEAQGQGLVYSARFVEGGQILTACADGSARLWDGTNGQLRQTYRGGSRFLVDATTSPDGSMIVGGGGDGVLRFWETSSGLPLWRMPAHKSHLIGIRVDGDDIVTRGFSGDISRWSLPRSAAVIEACSVRGRCAIVPP